MPVISPDEIQEKPSSAPPQGGSTSASGQEWFNQFSEVKATSKTPSKSTQKVSIKTPEKPKATSAAPHDAGDAYLKRHGLTRTPGPVQTSTPLVGAGSAAKAILPTVAGYATGYAGRAAGLPDWANVPLSIAAGILTGKVTEPSSPVEPSPKQRSSAPTRPYSELVPRKIIADPEPVKAESETPKPVHNPPNPRKVAPKATVPVEGSSDAEQRADFARAQEALANRVKGRKTPPWESRGPISRTKVLAQQQEAAAKANKPVTPEPAKAAVVAPSPQPEGSLGLQERPAGEVEQQRPAAVPATPPKPVGSLGLQERSEGQAEVQRPAVETPPKPVGSLGLQDAVENPAPVETPKPAAEPVTKEPVEQKARDGKVIWKKGYAVPDYDEVVNIDPHDLKPDPARFQYKQEAIGKGGTTDEFRDVKEWDPGLGGAMAVWQDPATDEVHPINGHHRTEMAQRTNAPHVNVRFIDAKTPTEARTFGAMLNIGEGKGTALDAAKLFRDGNITPEDLAKYKISPTSKLAVQGMALSKLEPTIYRQVVDGKMTPLRGALIGDLLGTDHAAQQAAVDFFKQSDRRGTRYNDAEAADIIRSIKSTPEATEEIENLFGIDEVRRNLFGERAQVSASIGKRLGREKGLFNLVSKKSNAEQLTGAGNILNAEDNQKISQEAAQVMAVYDRLKFSSGPVADALNEAAKEVAEGVDLDVATAKAYSRIKDGVAAILGGGKSKPATAGSIGKGSGAGKS